MTAVEVSSFPSLENGNGPLAPTAIPLHACSAISFKVLSRDGERILTFRGEVNANEISFIREITVLDGGSRGGNGLYGGTTALGFLAKRSR